MTSYLLLLLLSTICLIVSSNDSINFLHNDDSLTSCESFTVNSLNRDILICGYSVDGRSSTSKDLSAGTTFGLGISSVTEHAIDSRNFLQIYTKPLIGNNIRLKIKGVPGSRSRFTIYGTNYPGALGDSILMKGSIVVANTAIINLVGFEPYNYISIQPESSLIGLGSIEVIES